MPDNPRTFKLVDGKPMTGKDVELWQIDVFNGFKKLGIFCPITRDGIYGQATRGFTASLCEALGLVSKTAMAKGVTPELRTKLRHRDLNKAEKTRFESKARKEYRAGLKKRWNRGLIHAPVSRIITDAWGFHPGVHDGVDVQSIRGAAAFSMVRCRIIDVRIGDWWGANPTGNVSLGDGIVQMEVLDNQGPFKKGYHIGYGHLEQPKDHPVVKVGQVVDAGHIVGIVGLAVTPHIHLMYNDGSFGNQGRGNIDPRRILDYAVKNG